MIKEFEFDNCMLGIGNTFIRFDWNHTCDFILFKDIYYINSNLDGLQITFKMALDGQSNIKYPCSDSQVIRGAYLFLKEKITLFHMGN